MPFASNHRGNPVHAGKRTMDNMKLLYPGGAAYNFGDKVGVVTPTAVGENGEERFEAHMLDNAGMPNMSDAYAVERATDDAQRDGFGMHGGVNRSGSESWHSGHLNEPYHRKGPSGFRTEKRAEIALGAYKNRMDEGRSLVTGKSEEY